MYLLAFAQYLSDGEGIPVEYIDVELLRTRYGALLWDYASKKIEDGVVSDNVAPPKINSSYAEFDNSEMILIN